MSDDAENEGAGEGQSENQGEDQGAQDAQGAAAAEASGEAEAQAPALYRPEGMDEADLGKTDQETIDRLYNRFKGLREQVSKTEVPKSADDYGDVTFSDEFTAKHGKPVSSDDKMLPILREAALEAGLPKSAFGPFVGKVLERAQEAGLIAEPVNPSTEFEKAGGEEKFTQRASALNTRLEGLKAQGRLDDGKLNELQLLTTTADGLGALEALFSLSAESGVQTGDGSGAGAVTKEQVLARMDDPRYDKDSPKFDPVFVDETRKLFRSLGLDKAA
tara:strand:- start:299 stop:1123 length:825 start_codon:yes stop_codon:yes gene_type:complete